MKRFTRNRNLRLFSASIVDQVVLSLGNFLVGFLLIRQTTDFDYGLFVLVQSTITLLISAQSSWLSGPLMVAAPHKPAEERLVMIGSIERSQRRTLLLVANLALVVPLVCFATGVWSGLFALIVAAAIAAGLIALLRDFLRNVLLIFARTHSLLLADIVYVVILLGGATFAAFGPAPAALAAVSAVAVGGTLGGLTAYASIARNPGWRGVAAAAGPYWRELRPLGIWSAVGAVIYWTYSQSYNYVLAVKLDLTAVADVNAARLLLMPAFILTIGVKATLTPLAATWLAGEGVKAMMRRVKLLIPVIAVVNLVFIGMVWFGRDLLTHGLMHKAIHDREFLILGWASIVLVSLVREILQCAAFVLGQVQSLAWLGAVSAAVCLPVMWFGIGVWGPGAAMVGQVCGEMAGLIGVIWLLRAAVSRHAPNQGTIS